jgi:hypothetical protein
MKEQYGQIGENILWDGPLSQENRMHKKGSSSGPNGMKLKLKLPCGCVSGCECASLNAPITQRVKGR